MTCEQFRAEKFGEFREELREHSDACESCREWVGRELRLAGDFRLVQENVPEVSIAMDALVMKGFREVVAQRKNVVEVAKRRFVPVFAFAAIAAALVLAAVLIVWRSGKPEQARGVSVPPAPRVTNVEKPAVTPTVSAVKRNLVQPKRRHIAAPPVVAAAHSDAVNPAIVETPVSGFQSLMYCDSLSCAGAMDVIRIQVPVSAFHRVPAARSANGFVQADVAVGSDGVARAIRIVQ